MSQVISVTLPASTLYVSGTVNDVSVVWTHTGDDTWEAEAARAEDDVYRVSLTIIDANGNTSYANAVLYYGLRGLITDRTAHDVYRWKELRDKGWQAMTDEEKTEWLSALRGAYNYTDFNRVEGAVEYVANRLTEAGYVFRPVTKLDWKMTDLPTNEDMQRYFGNVAQLRNILQVPPSTPRAPTTKAKFTHEGANNLEQIISDVGNLTGKMYEAWYYAGDLICGEV